MNETTVRRERRCSKCGETKPATYEFFAQIVSSPDGCYSRCRPCQQAVAKEKRDAARKLRRPYEEIFAERFWSKVNKDGPVPSHSPELGACWEWTAYRGPMGYGEVGRKGPRRTEDAHRVSWELSTGAPAGTMCVLHKCDNPPCCNPGHLFLGTRTENMADKVRKGRQHHGSRHPGAILNERTVTEAKAMLASGATEPTVAARFGVSRSTICAIAQGRTWKHVV